MKVFLLRDLSIHGGQSVSPKGSVQDVTDILGRHLCSTGKAKEYVVSPKERKPEIQTKEEKKVRVTKTRKPGNTTSKPGKPKK